MLRVDSVSVSYGPVPALRNVSLKVNAGQTVAILGPNGAGKTSLVHAITGVAKISTGTIVLKDRTISGLPANRIARLGVSLVPEGRHLFHSLTVKENLILAAKAVGSTTFEEDLTYVVERFSFLKSRLGSWGDQLSGGQAQMVAIARAIMQRPSLILLDEPSTGLAPVIIEQLPQIIIDAKERTGAAVLLIEQSSSLAEEVSQYAYVIRNGSVIIHGPTAEIASSRELFASYLGGAVIAPDAAAK